MQSKVIFTQSLSEVDVQIQTTIQQEFRPTLPIIFAPLACNLEKLVNLFNNYYIQALGASTAGEITILVLDNDKMEVKGIALCGWQPIRMECTITKASDNVIYEINEESTLNIVKKYFGGYFTNSMDEEFVSLGVTQYPLQIVRPDGYVLHPALSVNSEDGSFQMASPIYEGDQL